MYRPKAFAVDAALHDFIRIRPFATIAATIGGTIHFAYAPVVLGPGDVVRFHLARANPLASLAEGARVRFSFLGPDAYVSPDWYVSAGMVPTWNYMAVEGEGIIKRLDESETRRMLVDLSAAEEEKLLPKEPWTIDKVPAEKMAMLLNAIVGMEVVFTTLEGKFKLSQNVKPEDMAGLISGLERTGSHAATAVASKMKRLQATEQAG
ncbi:MAG: FMN-binding negative transcriptional regulator [Proteobacteria bacterium]|nr:FMN-binding negative transcriptional regulator [Pseudomonadota bacterium]